MNFKSLKFGPTIADHDLNVKIKQIDKMLLKGEHVKCIVSLSGRNILYPENGDKIFDKIIETIQNGKLVNRTKLKGNTMEMFIAPKNPKNK